jgi:hypothetical protein
LLVLAAGCWLLAAGVLVAGVLACWLPGAGDGCSVLEGLPS